MVNALSLSHRLAASPIRISMGFGAEYGEHEREAESEEAQSNDGIDASLPDIVPLVGCLHHKDHAQSHGCIYKG